MPAAAVPPESPAGSQASSSATTHVSSSVASQPLVASSPSSTSLPASSLSATSAAGAAVQSPTLQTTTSIAVATSTSIAPHASSAVPVKRPHASASSTQSNSAQSTALSASTTGSNDDDNHSVPVAAIAAAAVVGSLVLAAILYKLYIIRARRKTKSAPLPPVRPGFAGSGSGSRPGSNWSGAGFAGYSLPFASSSNSSRSSFLSEMKFAPPPRNEPSPSPLSRTPLARTYATAPDVVRDRAAREMGTTEADSPLISPLQSPTPTSAPESTASHGTEDTTSHPLSQARHSSSSRTVNSVAQPAHHPRSQSRSSTGHHHYSTTTTTTPQSPSRRVSGAPHLPHVRSRVEIVLPAPLSVGSQQQDGSGNSASMQRMNSRSSMRSADSWTGMSVGRHDGADEGQPNGACFYLLSFPGLCTDASVAPSSWRRSNIPAVPPIPPQHSNPSWA